MKTEEVLKDAQYAGTKNYLDNLDKVFEVSSDEAFKEPAFEEMDTSRQVAYGFRQGTMSVGNIGRVLKSGVEALTKPGDFEFHSKLNEMGRQLDIQKDYPEFTGVTPETYTTAMKVGEVGNYVLDPINIVYGFLPGGIPARAAQFAGYEAGAEVLRQEAVEGSITDPTSVAVVAAISGVSSLGLDVAFRGLNKQSEELIEEVSKGISKNEAEATGIEITEETVETTSETLKPITTQAEHVRAWWKKSLAGQHTELSRLRQRGLEGEDIAQAEFVRAWWKASGADKGKVDVDPVLAPAEKEAIQESVASLKTPAKKISFEELSYQERLIQISKVDNILKKLEKRLKNPRYNSSKVTAKIAEVKAYKAKLQQNIEEDAMSLVTGKSDAIADTIEDLASKGKLTNNIFASLLAEAVRPVVGAAGGGIVGNMFDDDDDHNWMYWGMFAGAGFGHLSKRLNNSAALTDIQKSNGDLVINEAYHALAGRTMAKLKILTASTQATKMDAAGGWAKVIGNKLFSRIATGDAYSLEAKVQRLHSDFFARLNSVITLPETKNILEQVGTITEKSVLQMNESNRTVNTIAGEVMRGFIDINSLKAGYKGLAGDLKPLTENQIETVRQAVGGYREQLAYVKEMVEDAGIPFKDLGEDYGLPQLWNLDKANNDYFTFVKDLEEAIKIQKANGGKGLNADSFATNVTTKPAFRDSVESRRSDFFQRDPETGLTTFRNEAIYFENTRQLTDANAVKYLAERGWLKLDAQEVLTEYGMQTIKVAEFAKAFGAKGELINLAFNRTKKAFQEQARNLSPKEAQKISKEREAYEDLIINGIEAFWGRYGRPLHGEVGQSATTAVRTLQALANMKYLTTVAIANLPDLLQPFINSGFGEAAKVAMTRPFKQSFAKQGNFKYDATWERELMNFTSGGMIESRGQAFLANTQDVYFKLVGLKTVTHAARNFAYDVGVNRAYNLAKKAKLSKSELKELKSMGLTKDNLSVIRQHKTIDEAYADASGANVFLDIAGRQSADRDAIIPLVGNRLLFTQHNNPFIRSMGQFLSWTMAKSAQLNKVLTRVEDGDARLALKMLATVPVYAGLREMKGFLNPGLKEDPYKDEDYIDKALRGLRVSGQASNWAVDKIAESMKYNISSRDNFTGGFSPAMGYMEESLKALGSAARQSDLEEAAEKIGEAVPIVSQAMDVAEKYATGGEVKEEVAQELKDNQHLNFVKRIFNPQLTIEIVKGRPSTHRMASAEVEGKEIVYPTIVEIKPGKLEQLSDDEAIKYAIKTGEYIEFDNVKDARAFAEGGYKKGTRLNKAKGGEVEVPNASPEPDERIDKMTGLPYNLQAGIPFRDEEDPLKRLGLAGGGTVTQQDPLQRMGFGLGSLVAKGAPKLLDEIVDAFDTKAAKALAEATPEGSVDDVAKSLDEGAKIKAYHGSPYDFDRFSLDAVGTGDGARLQGFGINLAEDRQAAEGYAKGPAGRLYKTVINADPDQFIDWDLPLYEQSKYIQNILRKNEEKLRKDLHLGLSIEDFINAPRQSGEGLYSIARTERGGEKEASEYLSSLGIKGTRSERGLGFDRKKSPPRYVVFDDSIIDIESRGALLGDKYVPERYSRRIEDTANLPQSIEEVKRLPGAEYFKDDAFRSLELNPLSRETIIVASPEYFLKLADVSSTPAGKLDPLKKLLSDDEKFADLPFLEFIHDGKGQAKIIGHEGRHRMLALQELGVKQVPIRLKSNESGKGRGIRWGVQNEPNQRDYLQPEEFPLTLKAQEEAATPELTVEFPLFKEA